ncbi:MAG: TonB-dependent receptor [Alphaproteobacteria bacterium]
MFRSSLERTRSLRAGVSLIAMAGALVAMSGAASAQSSGPETITVTGFRTSLEKSLQAKRNSTTAIDTITAEDIAKFPDLNLGEAVQRVPGVALARDGGEGRNISVRGLGPNFTRILVDGMEAQATTGGTDASGGNNRNRQFDFNIFASDLFQAITVQKTPSAQTEEGSLGATVNLGLASPLDNPGLHFTASLKEGYNDLAKTKNPRASAVVSHTFLDDRLGFLLGVAYTGRELLDVGTSTVRWRNSISTANSFFQSVDGTGATAVTTPGASGIPAGATTCTNSTTPASCATADSAYHPRFPRFDLYESDQTRRSAAFSVEFQPWDDTHFAINTLYADFAGTRREMFLEAPSFSVAGNCTTANGTTQALSNNANSSCGQRATDLLAGYTIQNSGVPFFGTPPAGYVGTTLQGLNAAAFDDVDLRVENRFDKLDTKFRQIVFKGEHEFSDRLRVDALVGYAASKHRNPIQTTLTWDQFDVDGFSYDYTQSRVPLINWGNADLINASDWILTQIRLRPQTTNNAFKSIQLNGEWDAFDGLTFRTGFNFKRYAFATTEERRVGPVANGYVYPITTPPGPGNPWTPTAPFFSTAACNTGAGATNVEPCIPATVGSTNATGLGLPAGIPTTAYAQLVNFPLKGLSSPAGNVSSWVVPNYDLAVQLMQLYNPALFPTSRLTQLGANRGVLEDDTGIYGQMDWDFDLAGMPVRGNFGIRHVRTKQTTTGYGISSGTTIVPGISKRSYRNTLPSFNFVVEPFSNILVRLAAAKVMVRPDLGNLVARRCRFLATMLRLTLPIQKLNPFAAKTYDAAFEWYFLESLLSVAYFKKDLQTAIVTSTITTAFNTNPFGLPDQLAIDACGVLCTPASTFNYRTVGQFAGGTIKGVELTLQMPFSELPSFFGNFGILANYTYITSNVKYPLTFDALGQPATFTSGQLQDLSRRTYNWTLL